MAYTKQVAEYWLFLNHPQYQIKEWGGPGTVSLFLDLKRNIEFTRLFSDLKTALKRNSNVIFDATREEIAESKKATNLSRYGAACSLRNEAVRRKIKETNVARYGCENVFASKEIQQKIKETNVARYGCENASSSEIVQQKTKETNIERYGVEYHILSENVRQKIKKTMVERHGCEHALQNFSIKQKMQETRTKPEVQERIKQTRLKNGTSYNIDGKMISEIAKEKNVPYSTASAINRELGSTFLLEYKANKTKIEQMIQSILEKMEISFLYNRGLENYRPDFLIEDKKLIIECDGLYWHSDATRSDTSYHKKKKEEYERLGYDSLFFRENEIFEKLNIVESIIRNKIGKNERIFARKCEIKESKDTSFFEENHLMGTGSGRIYQLLYEFKPVAAIQVKWKNKDKKQLEISRFCAKNGISVVGGYSKLIAHVEKQEEPSEIITFIDRRYGDGSYLTNLGFEKKTSSLSFAWTDMKSTYHRMNFPGNSGYEHGMFKIWDCGQTKMVKKLDKANI